MKKKNPNKITLAYLKYNALKLRENHQLPYQLVKLILDLDKTSDIKKVKFLSSMSEHYLRVKGYYKKYPEVEEEVNVLIEKAFKELDH